MTRDFKRISGVSCGCCQPTGCGCTYCEGGWSHKVAHVRFGGTVTSVDGCEECEEYLGDRYLTCDENDPCIWRDHAHQPCGEDGIWLELTCNGAYYFWRLYIVSEASWYIFLTPPPGGDCDQAEPVDCLSPLALSGTPDYAYPDFGGAMCDLREIELTLFEWLDEVPA